MQILKHQSSSLSPDVDVAIHPVLALPTIVNATTALELDTSLPCAKGPETPNIWLTHLTSTEARGRSRRSASKRRSSRSSSRGRHTYRSTSHNSSKSRYSSASCSPSQDHHQRRSQCRRRCSPTPYRHQGSHIMSFNSYSNEDQLYTDRAPDGQKSFHTTLQLVTKQGCKSLPVKVDPGTDVNTIPLSQYKTLFPNDFTGDGQLKKNALRSTTSTWSPHDGTKKQFLGYFTIDVQHKTPPKSYH